MALYERVLGVCHVKISVRPRLCTGVVDGTHGSTFEALFREEHASVVRAAYLITGDLESARDVAQDAFADLFARWRRIRRYDRPGAWVRKVAVQRALKVAKRVERADVRHELGATTGPDSTSRLDVLNALKGLTAMQRAVVVLHYYEDRPVKEAAELLGCRPATASVHLHRARARLAEMLGEEVTADAR